MHIQPQMLVVKDEPGLVRDTSSNAILASDLSQKKKFLADQKRELSLLSVDGLNNRVVSLENQVGDIKQTVNRILELLERQLGN